MNKIELATIKPEFLKNDEADLTYVVLERNAGDAVIKRLHDHGEKRETRTVPVEWLNVFDQIENEGKKTGLEQS